jgi:nitroreductase
MLLEPSFFGVIHTERAVREFTHQPVGVESIKRLLTAATFAPSGSNSQPWEFIVVQNPELKRRIRDFAWSAWCEHGFDKRETYKRDLATKLAHDTDKTPVLIFVGLNTERYEDEPASIYPAVQNILLSANALGLGACLTTTILSKSKEIRKLLRIPDHVKLYAMIYLGYPARKYKPPKRIPAEAFTHYDEW